MCVCPKGHSSLSFFMPAPWLTEFWATPAHVADVLSSLSQPQTQNLTLKELIRAMTHISQLPRMYSLGFLHKHFQSGCYMVAGQSHLPEFIWAENCSSPHPHHPKPDSSSASWENLNGKPTAPCYSSSGINSKFQLGPAQHRAGISCTVPHCQEAGGGEGESREGKRGGAEGGRDRTTTV